MPDLGKAYVQIIPKAEGITENIKSVMSGGASEAGRSAGTSIGGSLVSSLKGVIAAAGIGTAIKATLEAGGALQQSFGGLDTIYGDASEAAKKYAYEASQVGISANDYAEQAVSFGAALKAAYGGDTTQAMEAANTAILDMTDNAAKMGTPIENIQNAYQGFAKQNYTMLDNLKLGYGGTKSEMERLLADATELSGVEYNMDNLGDVYDAIHVIQEDLGLTGVAAAEASTTFEGSFGAMQAAAQNLLANLSTGADITEPLNQLMQSAQTFIFDNLAPMIGNIAAALPELVSGLGTAIITGLNIASNNADALVQQGAEIVAQLALAILEAVPYIVESAIGLVTALGEAFINTDWGQIGNSTMSQLKESLSLASSEILGSDTSTITSFLDGITRGLPNVLSKGVEIVGGIVNGIYSAYPTLITVAGGLVNQFLAFVLQNLPTLLTAGADLVVAIVQGISSNLPEIASSAGQVIGDFLTTILDNLPSILEAGIEMIGKLVAGVISAIPDVIAAIIELCVSIGSKLLEYDWGGLGKDMLDGIGKGITSATTNLINALWGSVNEAIAWVKSKLHIGSPSKLMADLIGKNMALGIAVGFEDNLQTTEIATAVQTSVTSANNAVNYDVAGNNANNSGIDYMAIYEAVRMGAEAANIEIDIDGRSLKRELRGLGVQLA